jgi:peptidoglycan/LPS O-acetylase OafA/YrhL
MKYRPDIDGLRTIAVLSVIVYHAKISMGNAVLGNWQLLPGGYLGVDIFFVISGYLITTLLMTELAASGRISFMHFYERRVRRLLPGLLVVMLASLPFAWKFLLPQQLVDFSNSLIFSLAFSSNFYWDFSLHQYESESALFLPFLHTWSLAVEEQYYIVFPLLLVVIYRWGRQYLARILTLLLVLSLVYAQWMTGRDASFSFYMMPTRFWELLVGSLLALAQLNNFTGNPNRLWQRAMPSLGLLMVVGSLVSFDFDMHHPGFITLIPVVGTVLIICFRTDRDWVTCALSRPAMVYFGLLSYSLYLWHYPIFAFGRMVAAGVSPTIAQKGSWIVLTLLLSVLSYHLVEKPFRSKRISRRVLILVLCLASCLVIFVSLYWIRGDGIPSRSDYVRDLIHLNEPEAVRQNGANCTVGMDGQTIDGSDYCVFEYSPGAPTLVLVGDSHADAIGASVRALAIENQLNFAQISNVGCPHVSISDWCKQRTEALSSMLKELESPTIIYSARLPLYIEREPFYNPEFQWETDDSLKREKERLLKYWPSHVFEDVVEALTAWVADGYGLVIVYPVPEQGFHASVLLYLKSMSISGVEELPILSTDYDVFKKRVARSYSALDMVTGSHVRRVYPERLFCREESGRCIASESDRIYILTDNHVGVLGSDLIVREVAVELGLKVPDSFRK